MVPFRLTPAVKYLLIAIFAGFLIQQTADQFFGANLLGVLGLIPAALVNQAWVWQLVTYAFLHGDPTHLFLNMMMLLFLGSEIEALWGARRFLTYYFFCSISAGLVYLLLQVWITQGLHTPMVGASGAIYGLLTAYGIFFGERTLLFMLLFPMKAKHFVWILAGLEFFTSLYSRQGGLSSVAHLAGMASGFLFLYVSTKWRQRQTQKSRTSKSSGKSHLRLVVDPAEEAEKKPKPKTWH